MKRLRNTIGAAAVLALAGIGLFTPGATADTFEFQFAVHGDLWAYENAYSGNTYGFVVYEDGGDEIYIQDNEKDGQRVAGFWSVPALNRTGLCVNKAGDQALLECNKSFAEGHRIYIKFAGRCNGSVSPCNKVSDYTSGAATDSTTT
jgi:hypothetical protein